MSGKPKDIKGQRFGRLVVLSLTTERTKARGVRWLCRCDCGAEKVIDSASLVAGRILSCGCRQKDVARSYAKANFTTHGKSKTKLYKTWSDMIQRCANPNDSSAYLYGARGISVCLEWRESFETFEAWALSHDYAPDLTIDRKDPDGNYEPENCRWITNAEQQGNRRNNHRVTAFGKTQTIAEWMRDSGIASATIIRRLKLGWLPETAVSKEVRKCQKKKH